MAGSPAHSEAPRPGRATASMPQSALLHQHSRHGPPGATPHRSPRIESIRSSSRPPGTRPPRCGCDGPQGASPARNWPCADQLKLAAGVFQARRARHHPRWCRRCPPPPQRHRSGPRYRDLFSPFMHGWIGLSNSAHRVRSRPLLKQVGVGDHPPTPWPSRCRSPARHALGTFGELQLGAVRRQHRATASAHRVGHGENQPVEIVGLIPGRDPVLQPPQGSTSTVRPGARSVPLPPLQHHGAGSCDLHRRMDPEAAWPGCSASKHFATIVHDRASTDPMV